MMRALTAILAGFLLLVIVTGCSADARTITRHAAIDRAVQQLDRTNYACSFSGCPTLPPRTDYVVASATLDAATLHASACGPRVADLAQTDPDARLWAVVIRFLEGPPDLSSSIWLIDEHTGAIVCESAFDALYRDAMSDESAP